MKAQNTARKAHVTERQKAWARLALLTIVGLVCPPLAAARSGAVWGIYLAVLVLYSVWTVYVVRAPGRDRRLGYLLCLADAVMLVPMMVWSMGVAMRAVLVVLWLAGAVASVSAAQAKASARARRMSEAGRARWATLTKRAPASAPTAKADGGEAPLERALRVRLRVFEEEKTRFAVVLLKVTGYEALVQEHGRDTAKGFLKDVGRRGLRLLGPDAQVFFLHSGRLAFVFATDSAREYSKYSGRCPSNHIDPYDVESLAMALAEKACEQEMTGRPLECVVGWASAPADGATADDLMYAAESGVLSSAAFRRVSGTRVVVPEQEKKRAVAG